VLQRTARRLDEMIHYTEARPTGVIDSECYVNYWSLAIKCVDTGRKRLFEFYDGHPLDRAGIAAIFRKWRVITFNGVKYDMPMIMLAMQVGVTNEDLKRASDEIILTNMSPWKFYEKHGLEVPSFIDHIDLIEVNPGAAARPSLKICGGRLHSRRMQDLPFDPARFITSDDRQVMRVYLDNDLDTTKDLFTELKAQIEIRVGMSIEYGIDLRSKSDAQIAEAVIKTEVERMTKRKVWRPEIDPGIFNYVPPEFIRFQTQAMREVLHMIRKTPFIVDHSGVVEMPKFLNDKRIELGNSIYRMGIGGLHSSEESIAHESDEQFVLLDRDVTSYYPAIIITNKLAPKHLGQPFLDVYKSIFKRRIDAKRTGKKNIAEALKIVLNGSFGKFGSPYSVLYSPNLMIQTTLTGQLAILMMIEQFEMSGIPVVSANTDGVVSKVPRELRSKFNAHVFDWECATGLGTEETEYRGLYSRDVNAYIAVTPAGKTKTKGAYASCGPGLPAAMGLKKNPAAEISSEAAVKFLSQGTPIEQTINDCADVRKFLVVRRVTGGAHLDDVPIGKAIRWYYSDERSGPLQYIKDNKTVPRSDGAMPLLELPPDNECPDDLNRAWYIREAYAILQDVGYGAIDPDLVGRAGTFFGLLPKQKTIHVVDAKTGFALCGRERDSIREKWVEFKTVPAGQRVCGRCRKANEL